MKKLLLICAALVAAVVVASADATNATVTTSPNPTVAGGTFDITLCNFGGRYLDVVVVAPDLTEQRWTVAGVHTCGTITASAPVAGTYTVEVYKYDYQAQGYEGPLIIETTEQAT